VTPVSTPANVIAVPLCALVLICNLISLLVASWLPALAQVFNCAGWFLMECIRVSSQWFADWPGACFNASAPGLFAIGLYYVILLAVLTGWLWQPRLRFVKTAALAIGLAGWAGLWWQQHSVTRLTILPVNGGVSVFLDAPRRKDSLLVDCGSTNSVEFLLKPFLRAHGVNRLPALVLTHGDLRHVGGVALLTNLFAIKTICASPVRFRSPVYRRFVNDLSTSPKRFRTVCRDDPLGRWTILHPDPEDRFSQADDNALVLLGSIHGTSVLLLSDLGRPGQSALLERHPDLRADILVTGLPVQPEAICNALLDAIRPSVIVVADSEFPAAERASVRLRQRLAQRRVPVLYTRSAGATTIEWRQHECRIHSINGGVVVQTGTHWQIIAPFEPASQGDGRLDPAADPD
jgi:competence protein ComEC